MKSHSKIIRNNKWTSGDNYWQYFTLFGGAGVVNPITKGLPIASKVLARTLPDIAISAAQSGGDFKNNRSDRCNFRCK